jgi:hypothetical protein
MTHAAIIKVNPTCPHCAQKPCTGTGDYVGPTCGASECQEASYRESAACAKRPRRKR